MTLSEVMKALESMGTAQNRKVYQRHGYGSSFFGVSFANLGKLQKKIKQDQELAAQLWETGNGDARSLAILVSDPQAISAKDLDKWVKSVDCYVHAAMISRQVASKHPLARQRMEVWVKSKQDLVGQAGFDTLAGLAMQPNDLPDSYFSGYLRTIERDIHNSNNRTRHAMNGALIAIGLRNDKLRKLALTAAARIGRVEVDHGETGCKTPDAASYIQKTLDRARKAR